MSVVKICRVIPVFICLFFSDLKRNEGFFRMAVSCGIPAVTFYKSLPEYS